ncbi:thiamine pyrophosphate-dependent enzyme [Hahella sp. SMD15-11]|uniref:3-methyl-2-oxobutanoate dehydrogenase (2-methylpropanoyl-transferring) n=1 Tax=Thermohahella caldifontis TaxID=3142973 RepID=A0AB39UUM2_9GAMM
MQTRLHSVETRWLERVAADDLPVPASAHAPLPDGLTEPALIQLVESQILSRVLDLNAREMQAAGHGYYTIGSAGHEAMAAVATAFRPTDMGFLHYRDAAFLIERSKQVPGQPITWDMLLSFAARADDPVSGGRHKVLGSLALNIPPQTSTIASHLPKAVGCAHSIGLARQLKVTARLPRDAVILCSFGDASLNHSTAQGALNTAAWTAWQKLPMPLVFICEDNGLGISTPTPDGWVEASARSRPAIHYLSCDGRDLVDVYRTAREAEQLARRKRQPVFLHLRTVRLMGHAGSDAQNAYLTSAQIDAQEAQDPLLYSAGLLRVRGLMTKADLLDLWHHTRERVRAVTQEVIRRPPLKTAQDVMASLIPPKRRPPEERPASDLPALFGSQWRACNEPQPLGRLLNLTLSEALHRYPETFIAGEDVGRKGGVYGITKGLQAQYGAARLIDTLLDEQSILGLGIGAAHNGLTPITEIQFLAYVHNAEDQIRGEAATLSFFSRGQYTNPMLIRIAGLGYQRGFGGHFHNDNALAVFRDIPGLILICPAHPADAPALLHEALRLVREEQRVVIFLEPIALYHQRDLLPEDGRWTAVWTEARQREIRHGEVGVHGQGTGVAVVTYGNGLYLTLQVLARRPDIAAEVRVIDLRWLMPLPLDALTAATAGCDQLLIVDECRRSGSVSEALMTRAAETGWPADRLHRITAEDSFIPLGPAATATLPSTGEIEARLTALLDARRTGRQHA